MASTRENIKKASNREQLQILEVFDADQKPPEPRERARLGRESGGLGKVQSSKRETQQMIWTLGVLNEIMWSFGPPDFTKVGGDRGVFKGRNDTL